MCRQFQESETNMSSDASHDAFQLCRLCVTRRQLKERLKEQDEKLAAGKNTVTELVKTVESLKRLVESKDRRHDSVGASTQLSAAAPAAHPSADTQSPPTCSQLGALQASTAASFTHVKRGAKPVRHVIQPTVCSCPERILMVSRTCLTRCQRKPQLSPFLLFTRGQMMYERLAPRTYWVNIENLFNIQD